MKASVQSYRFSWFDWFCLWYPPGWLILLNRHWQHYRSDPDGWIWLEYGLILIPGGFYLASLIRWLRLGCRLPRKNKDCQFDPTYQQALRDEIFAPIVKYYFRGELRQIENLPQTEPLIVAMNHAGMCMPWDFLGLLCLLGQKRGWAVKFLAHPSVFDNLLINWWLPHGWWQVLGGVPAELDSFEAAVAQKKVLLYAPEGARGPGKGWQKRYQLESFKPIFISLSNRYQVPILPVVCIGNESLHPQAFNLKKLAHRLNISHSPFSIWMIFFILFPSISAWAGRARLRYYLQPLHKPLSQEASEADQLQITRNWSHRELLLAYQQAEEFREKLQSKINQLVK